MVVFGQSVVFGKKWLHSGKVDVFVESSCIPVKVDLFGKKVVFGQRGCFRAKVDVFGIKLSYSDKNGRIRAKWLYSGKSCCILAKVVVFEKE